MSVFTFACAAAVLTSISPAATPSESNARVILPGAQFVPPAELPNGDWVGGAIFAANPAGTAPTRVDFSFDEGEPRTVPFHVCQDLNGNHVCGDAGDPHVTGCASIGFLGWSAIPFRETIPTTIVVDSNPARVIVSDDGDIHVSFCPVSGVSPVLAVRVELS